MSSKFRTEIFNRVRTECAAEIQACFEAVRAHENLIHELTAKSLLPGQAESMRRHLESSSEAINQSCEDLENNAAMLARIREIEAAPSVVRTAKRKANAAYLELEPKIVALETAVNASLSRQIEELISKEKEFFAEFGFGREETAITRTAKSFRGLLLQHPYFAGARTIQESPHTDQYPQIKVANFAHLFAGLQN